MHTLAGKAQYGISEGQVFINGQPGNIQAYREVIGFVPRKSYKVFFQTNLSKIVTSEEDIMLRMMTVQEILDFSSKIRLRYSDEDKEMFVEEVLDMLGLSSVRFSKIGDEHVRGISGGQRKRVNVGIELVGDPTILFLDEPTSGLGTFVLSLHFFLNFPNILDSNSSKAICESLRQLCDLGLTILAVIHQPR